MRACRFGRLTVSAIVATVFAYSSVVAQPYRDPPELDVHAKPPKIFESTNYLIDWAKRKQVLAVDRVGKYYVINDVPFSGRRTQVFYVYELHGTIWRQIAVTTHDVAAMPWPKPVFADHGDKLVGYSAGSEIISIKLSSHTEFNLQRAAPASGPPGHS
jgi:hypothetical protein